MIRGIGLCALLLLTGCATPYETCVASATRDLRVLDGLIAQSEATLARGYAIDSVQVFEARWQRCLEPPNPATDAEGRPLPMVETLCLENVPVTQKRPRAVDLEAERRLLGQLRDKRTEASARAEREIARCRTLYPEG
ncbi:MAG: hypothetical protein ACO3XL_02370 [Gemmobacter sp.]|jgi:hypothetical protein